MAVTSMANLAVKVADLNAACEFYEARGAEVRDRMRWNNGERADVFLGPVMITLFTHAIYEDQVDVPVEGFLHPALFTDNLDLELEGHTVIWGPAVVEGSFANAASRSWMLQVVFALNSWSNLSLRRHASLRSEATPLEDGPSRRITICPNAFEYDQDVATEYDQDVAT